MPQNAPAPLLKRSLALPLLRILLWHACACTWAADDVKRAFDVPSTNAADSLQRFSIQAKREIFFPSESVGGATTNAIKGTYAPREAIDLMIANTGLVAVEDGKTGVLMIYNPSSVARPPENSQIPRTPQTDPKETATTMNSPNKKSLFATVVAMVSLAVDPATGQTAPSVAATGAEETVKLDPFNVNADSDVGFVAASSLAGGRMATALKDTPVAYSVLTKEFLDAFNVTDVASASEWTVNTTVNEGDSSSRNQARTSAANVTVRGIKISYPQRNYFPMYATPDSYNLDRVDFARGPNAVLFGAGGAAGTQNSVTKQAVVTKTIHEAQLLAGSWDHYRFTADINQPMSNKFAVRANAMWDQGKTWRDHEWNKKSAVHLAGTFNVTPRFTVRAEVEYGLKKQLIMTQMKDFFSAWDGRTYHMDGPVSGPGAPTPAQLAAAGIARWSTIRFVTHPTFGGDGLNFQGRLRTKGVQQNNDVSLTNRINGVPVRTVGLNFGAQAIVDLKSGIPDADRFATILAGSPFFHVPTRSETPLWSSPIPTITERGLSQSVTLNYALGENLSLEVAGNINRADLLANTTIRRGLPEIYIDIERTLPNGAANPNFLHPYSELMEYANTRLQLFQNLRAQAVYSKNTRIGKLQVSLMAGATNHTNIGRGSSILIPLTSVAADARTWVADNLEQNQFGMYTRLYFDQPDRSYRPPTRPVKLVNPVNGITEIATPLWTYDTKREDNNLENIRKYQFLQAAGNLDLLKNHLVLIGAFRRDFARLVSRRVLQPADNPPGWDGTTISFRQAPPADYFELTYFPKNTSGAITGPAQVADVRPRTVVNNVNLAMPQYANDRFRDDFDSPSLRPIVNTFTLGAVVNVNRWLGVYGNASTTFDLIDPYQKLDGSLLNPTASRGRDAGIRITLPNGRMALSAGWYNAYQAGTFAELPPTFTSDFNTFAATPVVGDLSILGQNARGAKMFPKTAIKTTVTSETTGYELELTANFTPAWRLILNAGKANAMTKDQNPDVLDYISRQDATTRGILADAGILIDANNHASINPALNDPTKINQTKIQAAVDAWNDLYDKLIPAIGSQQPIKQLGMIPWVGNVATDYRIHSGPLNGLRVGLGLNYRRGQVIGFRSGDTIASPNNPAVAIDDPTVNEYTPIFSDANYKVRATFSYIIKVREQRRYLPKTIQLDLIIDNLLDYSAPINANIGSSAATSPFLFVPRNGDYSSPARVTAPGVASYFVPRNFVLTAKFNF